MNTCDIADVRQVEAPTAEPVSVEMVKQHLRLGGDPAEYDDFEAQVLPLYVSAARQHAEEVTGLNLTDAVLELRLHGFHHTIAFPIAPVSSVESVTYTDTEGDQQTLDPSVYVLDDHPWRPRLGLAYEQSWPSVRSAAGAVVIRFRGPYGSVSESPPRLPVPEAIRAAILLMVGHWYENREEVVVGTITSPVPYAATHLLQLYRRSMGV